MTSEILQKIISRIRKGDINKIVQRIFYLRLGKEIKFLKVRLFQKKHDLIIIDDVFPHPLSPFRLTEFNIYLTLVASSKIYCTASSVLSLDESRSFDQVLNTLGNPYIRSKIELYNNQLFNARLAYLVFLNNVLKFLPVLEKCKVPFIFTLYPGGGFLLNDKECDNNLRAVFQSRYFEGVIVTQKITYDYLIDKNLCSKDKITFIFGIVMPTHFFEPFNKLNKILFPTDKPDFDICFVAHKYMPQGRDKGYDLFIETGRILSKSHNSIHFHVVGPWSKEDFEVKDFEENIHFYGRQTSDFFSEFYRKMDIILSPNRPFTLFPGAFDGFPTGSVTEASLNGVAMFVSDILNLNVSFKNNEEIVIVNNNPQDIVKRIEFYYNNPELLYTLANKGKEKSWEIYNLEAQMKPRIELIESNLDGADNRKNVK